MTKTTRVFSDIDLNFQPHPVTGDVVKRVDAAAVKASIRNLVMTANYERPFHSEIGSQVRALLFEPASPVTAMMLERSINQVIMNFEPRANVLNVRAQFSPDNNSVYVTVEFSVINTSTVEAVNLILERTR